MKKTVLIVEDEPAIADNIRYALETEGFATAWCQLAGEATKKLAAQSFDLVILDAGLPDGSGFDVLKAWRKTNGIPVIFLTARADEIDRVVGLEIGADDYLVKPFSPRELTARVKAVLRRGQMESLPSAAKTTDGCFRVDAEKCEISYFGEALTLTRYEYLLLKILVESPGRVFSRDALMEQVWDDPGSSLDRTVDAHVKNIRAELKKIRATDDPIRTHRGLGYSLKEA